MEDNPMSKSRYVLGRLIEMDRLPDDVVSSRVNIKEALDKLGVMTHRKDGSLISLSEIIDNLSKIVLKMEENH